MNTPQVNPIGITHYPEGFSGRARPAPLHRRVIAAFLLVLFALTVVTTSVASIGSYCLTSDGGDTRDLPAHSEHSRSEPAATK